MNWTEDEFKAQLLGRLSVAAQVHNAVCEQYEALAERIHQSDRRRKDSAAKLSRLIEFARHHFDMNTSEFENVAGR